MKRVCFVFVQQMRSQSRALSLSLHHFTSRREFQGWPENQSEIPIAFMTKLHRETIVHYCTRDPMNAVFPNILMSLSQRTNTTYGGNRCNATDNGPGGVCHLRKDMAIVDLGDTDDNQIGSTNDKPDYFLDTPFKTNSKKRVSEEEVIAMKDDQEAVNNLLKGSMPTSHPIADNKEVKVMCGIILYLLHNGDIESLDSGSTSSTSPKYMRSSLNIHGTLKQIEDQYPHGYSVAKTAYGKDVLKRLGLAIADTDASVGACKDKGQVYSLIWKGVPLARESVGAHDATTKAEDAGIAIGDHADGNSVNDKTFYTARSVNALGPDFHLDLTVYVVWMGDDDKKHQHKIRTTSLEMQGNHTYILPHWGSGRGAIAQTTWKGSPAVLVVQHKVWVDKKHRNSPRVALMRDCVFPTQKGHDDFLSSMSKNTPALSPDNQIVALSNTITKDNLSMKEYIDTLTTNLSGTIRQNKPYASNSVFCVV